MKTLVISFSLAFLLISSCKKESTGTGQLSELESNYKKWQRTPVTDYTITEGKNCFCTNTGPHQVTVAANVIASVKNASGQDIAFTNSGFKTINELFDYARASLRANPYRADIKYNVQYGYPESMYFDFSASMADEEMGYAITSFKKN